MPPRNSRDAGRPGTTLDTPAGAKPRPRPQPRRRCVLPMACKEAEEQDETPPFRGAGSQALCVTDDPKGGRPLGLGTDFQPHRQPSAVCCLQPARRLSSRTRRCLPAPQAAECYPLPVAARTWRCHPSTLGTPSLPALVSPVH